ncbi:MAG: hypothetical protein MI717_04625 [Spirochaetales bacterium]|nr:hypothetical protein [Spirochaetales bacterium]
MNRIKLKGIILSSFMLLTLLLASCDGVGVFAIVAVTDKIDEATLPEGISARPIARLNEVSGTHMFFASGPGLWVKPISSGSWQSTPLIDSTGKRWDGIQSMGTATITDTSDRIFLALYRVSGDNYTVALHVLSNYDSTSNRATLTPITDASWSGGTGGYQTIGIFGAQNSGDVYVNILEHDIDYGSIDINTGQTGFQNSELFRLPANATNWSSRVPFTSQDYLDGSNGPGRYVTGVASKGTTNDDIRITAANNLFSTDSGVLLNGAGTVVGGFSSTAAMTGLTWLPNVYTGEGNTGPQGAYFVAATALDDGTFPIFVSNDGTTWSKVSGTTTNFLSINFTDISDTDAGQGDDGDTDVRLVLVGTSSYIDGTTYKRASGYEELNTYKAIADWSINSTWSTYKFASNNNYGASNLKDSTIIGMSRIGSGSTLALYASTRGQGVWKIAPNSSRRPSWEPE